MLRDYQQAAVDAAISWHKYKDTPAIIDIATGGGKTHVISALVEHCYKLGQRVCVLAHRKELLEQNGNKLTVPFSFYSASVGGNRDINAQIVVAGIQSIHDKMSADVAPFNVIIVDECHRMPNNDEMGQYWRFIGDNAGCRLVGLTATPFRLSGGAISWGNVVYEAKYPMLLKMGHVSPITNKVKNTPDLSNIKIIAGDFNSEQLSSVMESPELIDHAVRNIIGFGADRDSILIFCVSVDHARLLTNAMQRNGLESGMVSGETSKQERDSILSDFKSGRLRHLLNCEILLEGFDAPNVDMIVCLRPTKSKALHEQMLGRGVRLYNGKESCLLIDMAGNLMEHGALGTPYREKSKREVEKKHGRICPECESFNKVTAKECSDCGYIFLKDEPPKASHESAADMQSDMSYSTMVDYIVTGATYREHKNKKGAKSLRVDYVCPDAKYGTISEWLSPWHENEWVRGKAHKFFKDRGKDIYGDIQQYSMEDLLFFATSYLKTPSKITVDHSGEFPRIKGYVYDENRKGNTEGASEVATDLLEGDVIPF